MPSKHQYFIGFFSKPFMSLEDAKWNVKMSFTSHEAIKYLAQAHETIDHFVNNKLHSQTPINVDEQGNITFGKTRKVI